MSAARQGSRLQPEPGDRAGVRADPALARTCCRALLAGHAAVRTLVALALLVGGPAGATPLGDTMPFRLIHGRPSFATGNDVLCYLWSEGGRLHLRILPTDDRHRVRGELRTSKTGSFRDVTPSSEELFVRQPRPSKIEFEVRTDGSEEGLDVTLGGDFHQLTIDLTVDDARRPDAVRIGQRRETPRGLPARLDVNGADPTWIERFGF